jgi:hypothetical protein
VLILNNESNFFYKKKLVGFFLGSPVAANNRDLAQDVVLDERNVRTEKKNCRTSSNTPGGEVRSTIFFIYQHHALVNNSTTTYTLMSFSGERIPKWGLVTILATGIFVKII